MSRVAGAALVYFALVMGAGFVFGIIRVLLLVPQLGPRWSELAEAPFMFAVILLAARHVVRARLTEASLRARLATGMLALVLVLASEFGVVLWMRGLTLATWLASRDDVAGAVYAALLLLFALAPALERRR